MNGRSGDVEVEDLRDMDIADMEALRIQLEMEVASAQAIHTGITKELRRRRSLSRGSSTRKDTGVEASLLIN